MVYTLAACCFACLVAACLVLRAQGAGRLVCALSVSDALEACVWRPTWASVLVPDQRPEWARLAPWAVRGDRAAGVRRHGTGADQAVSRRGTGGCTLPGNP